jgi:hypothetical protein
MKNAYLVGTGVYRSGFSLQYEGCCMPINPTISSWLQLQTVISRSDPTWKDPNKNKTKSST